MNRDKRDDSTKLEDQDQIINNYLESLLSEVVEYSESKTKTRRETAEIVAIRPVVKDLPEPEPEPEAEVQQLEQVEDTGESHALNEVPEWAQERFQCLLFKVRGMTLATPLLALDNIVKWETELTAIPGQPDWHMGVLQHRGQNVVVVDTAKLLIPDKLKGDSDFRDMGSHILIIGDNSFGLACDNLAKPVFFEHDDIRWSGEHPDRLWMAGTIKEKLSVLLDIEALLQKIRHE
ncbi:MAG: chemotaxis protein CheW [Gammaproteobacteria bacterium]|nr:chemotaxis protein CheW [Gammaproteobacteria bacterium]